MDESEMQSGRMDFVLDPEDQEVGDDGHITGIMKPNPDRYEWHDNGLYDTHDGILFTHDELEKAAEGLSGANMHFSPPEIDDVGNYIQERIPKMRGFLKSERISIPLDDESERVLDRLSDGEESDFVIMCVDIVGSTHLIRDSKEKSQLSFHLFLREIANLIRGHHGYVLKFIGDGLIGYFPEPDYIGMHDNAIQCAVAVSRLMAEAINPILTGGGFPVINYRTGLDSGKGTVKTVGRQKDILGETVHLASKIESQACVNDILIGETTERHLHTDWRKLTEEVTGTRDWDYKKSNGEPYGLYRLSPQLDDISD